jgi:hypothetical protein
MMQLIKRLGVAVVQGTLFFCGIAAWYFFVLLSPQWIWDAMLYPWKYSLLTLIGWTVVLIAGVTTWGAALLSLADQSLANTFIEKVRGLVKF